MLLCLSRRGVFFTTFCVARDDDADTCVSRRGGSTTDGAQSVLLAMTRAFTVDTVAPDTILGPAPIERPGQDE